MNQDVDIRRLRVEDAKTSWVFYRNSKLWEYAIRDFVEPASYDSIRNSYIEMVDDLSQVVMAIMYKNEFVGIVKLKNIDRGYAELSYYIFNTDVWGKGIAKYAIEKILYYGFDVLNLDVISAFVNPKNERSYKMIMSMDFYRSGISIKCNNVERLDITHTRWKTRRLKYAN